MSVFRKQQNEVHSMQGNHIAGVATRTSGARQVEMWRGRMDANSATPPHSHDTEEVVLFLSGSGRATVADREVRYAAGDTLILPPAQVHQIFAETDSEFVSAMPLGGTVKLPDGVVMELPWGRGGAPPPQTGRPPNREREPGEGVNRSPQ
ncbi:MAG: cupin domain-containing protein, partial [Deltaproteobacteria bacterium]|nr:cupin domain-containing protein [Deltaproteobacteria bacterium]